MFPRKQKDDHLFWDKLLLWHLELHQTFDLTHLQVFLAQPVITGMSNSQTISVNTRNYLGN